MRAYSDTASPHSYEIWFTYVAGAKPFLNDAVKNALKSGEKLTEEQIEALYDAHLSTVRLGVQAERAGTGMLSEIEQVVAMIDDALGSTTRYGASLQAISEDLAAPQERSGLRDILEALVAATREVAANNRSLEMRLRDSRGEIEALREALERVRVETLTDPLTGISNRKHFEEMLISATISARANESPLSLVVIDIDHFKRFNDTYGHLTGDQVLRLVSTAMGEQVQGQATLARFGGEEFAMILPGLSREQAFEVAEKVRRNVEARELMKRSTGESLGRITVSLGVAVLRRHETATSLLDRADTCMYRAKGSGRNRTVTDLDPAEAAALSDAA
ncbi:GGDEF domain-containing protein [Enterovirga sp. DB1703]|uniref:diguanylate cyclase n=2 Tax=Enterovirga aerilata TaxID=2730920 RepID=A0A849I5X1_9HYPH|nr:GGDEF domain-containing protein [Enterovirga sp. DB1703]